MIALVAALGVAAAPASARSSKRVISVSNPPLSATSSFSLKVKAGVSHVAIYASHFRRHSRGGTQLGKARIRHGKVTVRLPSRLGSDAYFIVVCPASGRGRCSSSRKPTIVLRASSLPDGHATPAAGTASKQIGEAGGMLQASRSGTTFTLQAPARSLPDDTLVECTFQQQFGFWRRICPQGSGPLAGETVTMTPLAALSGAQRLGGFVAGVQLGPAGLAAMRGVKVSVALAHTVPAKRLVAVGYEGSGSAIHAIPFRRVKGKVVIALGELGGGVAILDRSKAASHGRVAAKVSSAAAPGGDSGRFEAMIGGEVSRLAQSGHDFDDGSETWSDTQEDLLATLADWHDDIARNEIPAGLTDDNAARVAIRDLIERAHDAALLGFAGTDVPPEVIALLKGIYNRAQTRCATPHAVSDAELRNILGAYRELVLAGQPDNEPLSDLTSCMRFKVTFDSTVAENWTGTNHGTITNEYRLAIPIALTPASGYQRLGGSGPGAYAQAAGSMYQDPQDCGANGGGTSVSHMDEVKGNPTPGTVPHFELPSARIGGAGPMLELGVGLPTETYHVYTTSDNPNCVGGENQNLPDWFGDFLSGHRGEVDGTAATPGSYVFALSRGSGATIGTRTYDQTIAQGNKTLVEHTLITVVHAPGKPVTLP